MIKFLKTYSNVPNKFIDDFFNITGEDYNPYDFSIDFDIVAEWLEADKNNLKVTLKRNFSRNIDYISEKYKKLHPNGRGSTIIEQIDITPLCFKELCMISTADNARKVRLYYIALEGLMTKYHYYIEKALREKIGVLENNQKPKVNPKKGIVYFFEALNIPTIDKEDNRKFYKMGNTRNKKNRFNTYNSGNANDINLLFIIEVNNINKVERCIKNIIDDYQYRKHKEVYEIDIDMLKLAFTLCEDLVEGFIQYGKKHGRTKFNKSLRKLHDSKSIAIQFK
jgi:phage anti-repressor protein